MDDTRVMVVDPVRARAVIEAFCQEANVPFLEAFTAAQAAELATGLDYVATPWTVQECIDKKYFSAADSAALSPTELYCFLAALEARRRWKPTPSKHDARKTGCRLFIEQNVGNGLPAVNDLDDHSIEDLTLQLVASDNRSVREVLYETLRLKLAGLEE
ncbi:MAG: hypothetical protein L0Y72_14185 [Gemmataceae bacterium]|nr:hypothetical protein [Gemmataceae bacterium]MCI0740191.1 hypothetical protein [Gemmataceae bacterium]